MKLSSSAHPLPPDAATTLNEVLAWHAATRPDRPYLTYLADGERPEVELSFGALHARVREVAALIATHAQQGDRALLLYPPGPDFVVAFLGCLAAGVVAVPAYPPRNPRHVPRIEAILTDAGAALVLTTAEMRQRIEEWLARRVVVPPAVVCTDTATPLMEWHAPPIDGDALAFLQYTSGSTGQPKGVMVTHANLLANERMIRDDFGHDDQSDVVSWLPIYHDMGLVGNLLQPLYLGSRAVLMSPAAFLQKPVRWLQAVSTYRARTTGAPNFAYDLTVRTVTEEQKAGLDLSSLTLLYNGSEPIDASALDRFAAAFASCGLRRSSLYPCYGMAETTLLATGSRLQQGPHLLAVHAGDLTRGVVNAPPEEAASDSAPDSPRLASGHHSQVILRGAGSGERQATQILASSDARQVLVGCGYSVQGQELTIVDPETQRPTPADHVGEIWLRGPHVARGYWGQSELTRETFEAFTVEGAGPFLRTGDLGFVRDTELYVTGRLKDLIIIRGRNYYPQDIERTVSASHPAFWRGGAAAFGVAKDGAERLVIVQELQRAAPRDIDLDEVMSAAVRAVTDEFELQPSAVVIVKPLSVPKTSSGKIQRRACREQWLAGELDVVAAWRAPAASKQNGADGDVPPDPPARAADAATDDSSHISTRDIAEWLRRAVAAQLGREARAIDAQAPFAEYGLDSVTVIRLSGDLAQWLGRELSPALLYDYPTIDRLARHLSGEPDDPHPSADTTTRHGEPIAIVGIGCRLPGGVRGPDSFWRLLQDGVDAITTVPSDRWDADALWDPVVDTPGRMTTRYGGFLEAIDRFDAQFFGISPREAAAIDPQQRLLLEVAWEALEHAGIAASSLAGSETAVFMGVSTHDYARLQLLSRPERVDMYSGIGNAFSAATGRLSYLLGVHGPSIAVDTACSSSLVAVHLACRSLRAGECSAALAGGVNVILAPELTVAFSKAGMMAPDGRCKTFDARADGYVRSEGCGVVVLKRLRDAVEAGDRVMAVIRGSAVNQDGRSNGLTAPNGPAQEQVIRRALRDAAVAPAEIDYVEAHGTGTSLGDPIEVRALAAALGEGRSEPVILGSVKTNVGHLEAAAGVVSLIKAALAINRGVIPASLHFHSPNPYIPWASLPVTVASRGAPWPAGGRPRRAGVSSFGFTGTNAHAVLEQYLAPASTSDPTPKDEPGERVLTVSAKDAEALHALVGAYRGALDRMTDVPLGDICHTANAGRSHFDWRVAVVAPTHAEMSAALEAAVPRPVDLARSPTVAWLFTGQGSQYAGVGRELYRAEPVFRSALDTCDAIVGQVRGEALLPVLFAEARRGEPNAIDRTEWTQPAIFSIGYALAELWRSWGITPSVVMGHSVGEFTAATVAGVFSLDAGLRLVLERGRLMQSLPAGGGMLAVFEAEQTAHAAIEGESLVGIAATNAPSETVLSGDAAALDRIATRLAAKGVGSKRLNVSHAFHSPLMAPIHHAFAAMAESVAMSEPVVALISNVTGRLAGSGIASARYWADHLTAPVRFLESLGALQEFQLTHAIELGPAPVLSGLAARSGLPTQARWLPSLRPRRSDVTQMLEAAAALYQDGAAIDWKHVDAGRRRKRVSLPTYPFRAERHWVAPDPLTHRNVDRLGHGFGAASDPDTGAITPLATRAHPLLGTRLPDVATMNGAVVWQIDAALRRGAVWHGHSIAGTPTPSAAVYPSLMLAAARETLSASDVGITRLDLLDIHRIATNGIDSVQVMVAPFGEGADCKVFVRLDGAEWELAAEARVERAATAAVPVRRPLQFGLMVFNGSEAREGRNHYQLLLEAARYADRHGLSSVWAPERHYTEFGGLYPNPSVIHAALARETRHVRLMAGSLVMPLHNPLRAAEDWALVDNLSNGRVGISLASGWNPNDFAMAPEKYASRAEEVFRQLETLRTLWRGESLDATSGDGRAIRVRTYPTPVQREFPACITAAGNPRTFERAGESGSDLLTHLLDQGVEELAGKIALYRDARARAGHDPAAGRVSVMLHTFLGEDAEAVREQARAPYCEYIKQNIGLLKGLAYSRGTDIDLAALSPRDLDEFVGFLYERFAATRALIGTPESSMELTRRLYDAGVDEIACLIDFGPPTAAVLRSLPHVVRLKDALHADEGPASAVPAAARVAIAAIESHCTERLSAALFYGRLAARGVEFGPGLRAIERFARRDGEALATLTAPSTDAGLTLDAALQTYLAALPSAAFVSTAVGIYVPWAAQAFSVHDTTAGVAYAHAVLDQPAPASGDLESTDHRQFTGSVTLLAADGTVVARLERLVLRRIETVGAVTPQDGLAGDSVYRLQWEPRPLDASRPSAPAGRWLVLADAAPDGLGAQLAGALREQGCEVTVAHATTAAGSVADATPARATRNPDGVNPHDPTAVDALVARAAGSGALSGVITLWTLDAGGAATMSAAALARGEALGVATTLHLAQALTRHAPSCLLWVITRGAEAVTATVAPAVAQAPVWGLGRIVAVEHPEIWGGLIDLDPDARGDDVAAIMQELGQPDAEDQIALRGDERLAPRLVRAEAVAAGTPTFDPEAVYLITGGVGAIGRRVAHWMVRNGAAHLVLTGLHALPPKREWDRLDGRVGARVRERIAGVQSLRAQGADVTVLSADGSRAADMDAVFAAIVRQGRPLRGIIHLAGVPENQPIVDVRFDRDRTVLAPKVAGAWLLHERSLAHPVDFFVTFSSIAAVWGSRGQPLYAAANHCLDALSSYRRAHGLPALTVSWGPWSEGGMVDPANLALLARMGVAALDPDEATGTLGRLLAAGADDRVVAKVDWRLFGELFEVRRRRPLLQGLTSIEPDTEASSAGSADFQRALDGRDEPGRRAFVLEHVQAHVATVLGWAGPTPPDTRKGFFEMGMDSLTALELKNRLQITTGLPLGGTTLFNYSTIAALTDYLLTRLQPPSPAAVTTRHVPEEEVSDANLSELSEDELARLLDEQIGAVDSASE